MTTGTTTRGDFNSQRDILQAPEDKFYGDRSASFMDPWGHRWSIATHIEDVSPEEMARRAAEAMGG